eukprot:TRINITY_DN1962_c3_g1_i1.p1 TRINITY_DN1962_c3_g1~~TRINITY_DN1962_c3_g1_i1.p1  ORF type:complete len:548 (+),score=116.16 TRINITY_DN1962_c3_g1_i1:58-1644(+)
MLLTLSVLSAVAVSLPYPTCRQGLNASAGKEIYVITENLSTAELTAVSTLQGAVGRERPLIYVGELGDYNMQALVHNFGVKPVVVGNFSDLLFKINATGLLPTRYAVYNETAGQAGMMLRNAAVSLAGLRVPGIAVTQEYVPLVLKYGMTAVNSNMYMTQSEVWEQYKDEFSSRILIQSRSTNLYDYGVFANAFQFYADPVSDLEPKLMADTFATLDPLSAVMGWIGGPVPREDVFVSAAAEVDSYVHCADDSRNLATLSQFEIPSFRQKTGKVAPKKDNVHTVSFLVSDGDSFGYDFHTFLATQWYLNPARGAVPLGWTLSSALSIVAPGTLQDIYQNMTQNDEFVSGPSGVGYAYPDRMRNAGDFAAATAGVMSNTNQSSVNVITGKAYETTFDPVPIAAPFLEQEQIKSVMLYNYFDYAIMTGRILKGAQNKPIVGARSWLCDLKTDYECLTQCGPGCATMQTVKDILKLQSKDTSSVASYSLIAVDAWHTHYGSIQKIISELEAEGGFRFVLPSQLVNEVTPLL